MSYQRIARTLAASLALAFAVPGAHAQQPAAAHPTPAGYAGSASCVDCHKKESADFGATSKGQLFLSHPRSGHEALGCEVCHGPAQQHVESGADERGGLITFNGKHPSPVAVQNAQCLQCHEKTARMLWKGSAHESHDVACTDCHTLMHTESERANLKRPTVLETCGRCHAQEKTKQLQFAHMPVGQGKMECTSCHNPHGSNAPNLLIANSVNEVCYSCHAEKRGPYLWEHAPVVENCANCHDPHGSTHDNMLKMSRPRLCQQCHAGTGHPIQPRNPATIADYQFVFNRQCSNCHVNIHGSNNPSGQYFVR
ncbi:MAG: DmsE family decaheme c-type cytochrome [Gemmatimonadaceae bacterium]